MLSQAKLEAAEADVVRLQMAAQGHMLELNHVDALRDSKAKIIELSGELEALCLAKMESGTVYMPPSILLMFRDASGCMASRIQAT